MNKSEENIKKIYKKTGRKSYEKINAKLFARYRKTGSPEDRNAIVMQNLYYINFCVDMFLKCNEIVFPYSREDVFMSAVEGFLQFLKPTRESTPKTELYFACLETWKRLKRQYKPEPEKEEYIDSLHSYCTDPLWYIVEDFWKDVDPILRESVHSPVTRDMMKCRLEGINARIYSQWFGRSNAHSSNQIAYQAMKRMSHHEKIALLLDYIDLV